MPSPSADTGREIPLREIQETFLSGVREERASLELAGTPLVEIPPAGSAEDRWGLYVEGYALRLIEAIENDYPAVARVLGEDAFGSLCRRYLRSHPPFSPDIGRAGEKLPAFLVSDPLSEALPFLPDLARFESRLAEAIVAEDPRPARWEELQALGADALPDLELAPASGVSVLRSEWPVAEIRALKDVPDEEISLEVAGRPSTLLIFRDGLDVSWKEVSAEEAAFVESLEGGSTLSRLADSGRFGEPERAAPILVSLLRSAIESSILSIGARTARTREHP
ncbi:MAG TPA: DNA-binding domain-containing protein [Candidatus Saccharimonadales bacterium]|nr:DNA-binding domain-containing protein [Candidatus Saccharimonadales bacterium]